MAFGCSVYDEANNQGRLLPPGNADSFFSSLVLMVPGGGIQGNTDILDVSPAGISAGRFLNSPPFGTLTQTITTVPDAFGLYNGVISIGTYAIQVYSPNTPTSNPDFNIDQPYTLQMWFRSSSSGANKIWGKGGGDSGWDAGNKSREAEAGGFFESPGFFCYRFRTVGGSPNYTTLGVTYPSLNTWHHFTATYDGVRTRAFLNGVSMGVLNGSDTNTPQVPSQSQNVNIGTSSNFTGNFSGQINFVSFHRSCLYTADFTPPSLYETQRRFGSVAWSSGMSGQLGPGHPFRNRPPLIGD